MWFLSHDKEERHDLASAVEGNIEVVPDCCRHNFYLTTQNQIVGVSHSAYNVNARVVGSCTTRTPCKQIMSKAGVQHPMLPLHPQHDILLSLCAQSPRTCRGPVDPAQRLYRSIVSHFHTDQAWQTISRQDSSHVCLSR